MTPNEGVRHPGVWSNVLVDGVHDLGGMQGFGPVDVEVDEPVFHEPWERRAAAITFGAFSTGTSNGGQFRHSIERMDAAHYLDVVVLRALDHRRRDENGRVGLLTVDELEERSGGAFPLSGPDRGVATADAGDDVVAPRFVVGEHVRVRNSHPLGHTRCPRYVRGAAGNSACGIDVVASVPDIEAHSTGPSK